MTVLEDLACSIVIPIVDDVLHDVGVAPLWNGRKEVAANNFATIRHARGLEQCGGPSGHGRKVEEDAAHFSVCFKNGCEDEAVSAGAVQQSVDPGEIVSGDHSLGLPGA